MNVRRAREERSAALRAMLRDVQVAELWQPEDPSSHIDVAVRRWTSSERRLPPARRTPQNRIQDLLRGLREAEGEEGRLFTEPGWLEHVAERFGAALIAAETAAEAAGGEDTPTP